MPKFRVTLVELAIVVIMLFVFACIALSGMSGGAGAISYGPAGIVEKRCISGHQFLVSEAGRGLVQLLDEQGRPVRCPR